MDGIFVIAFLFAMFSIISGVFKSVKREQDNAKTAFEERARREAQARAQEDASRASAERSSGYTTITPTVDVHSQTPRTNETYTRMHTSVHSSAPTVHESSKHTTNGANDCAPHEPVRTDEGDKLPLNERLRRYKERKHAMAVPITSYDDDAYSATKQYATVDVAHDVAFDSQSLVKGFIYSEILGKPKSRR